MLDFKDATGSAIMDIEELAKEVIIDEVHNLLLEMVQMYFTKYWRRLKGSNVTYIRQTIALLKALNKFMQSTTTDSNTWVVSVNEFLTLAHANHINVYKIDRYLRESKLGRKLNMFSG
ncbi:ATP-dependent DNA helicase chl1 [Coemansia sp. S16]|nr:ATP-dependent DNA helicase chl1 [Coemansia sp. S16]